MRTFDEHAWLVWLGAGGLLAIVISNPFYLVLLVACSRLVEVACAPLESRGWRLPFLRISLMILMFSTLFNMITAHVGNTILFTLPENWLLIGGPITLEAAVYGFISGLRLIALLSFFSAFNNIVPVSQLVGLTPRAIHELGLVLVIAITYVPETIRQYQRIRDAQAIRGHQLNGLRSMRPILIPLLIAGLERAMNLSETMVARGYGSTAYVMMPIRIRLLLLGGLGLVLVGAIRLAGAGVDGWLLLAVGGLAIIVAYLYLSRLISRTKYRPRRWTMLDTLVVTGGLISLLPLLPLEIFSGSAIDYTPYPQLHAPQFDLLTGIALCGLAIPAILTTSLKAPMEVSG